MMICPETFYEECLKGKSDKEITKVIRSLKREIGRLKNIVEHPDYKTREVAMHPRQGVVVSYIPKVLPA